MSDRAPRPPTLRDVARVAGVAASTVSKVLNGRSDVSPETRELVQDAVAAVAYRRAPSAAVDALIADQLVDLVLPAVGDSWASALIGGVERAAADFGLDLVIIMIRESDTESRSWVRRLIDHRSRGAIIAVKQPTSGEARELARARIPFVLVDPAGSPDRSSPSVRSSNRIGGRMAADWFIDAGHTAFAVICGDRDSLTSRERAAGFRRRVEDRLPHASVTSVSSDWTLETTRELVKPMLSRPELPSAIFACNDIMALGVYAAARELGVGIPDDVSIIGFDDVIEARLASPPLTTVRQPIAEIGAAALHHLMDLRDGAPVTRLLEMPTELVSRGSVLRRV